MKTTHTLLTLAAATTIGTLAVIQASSAADVEAFESRGTVASRPNVLFVIDSTATLAESVSTSDYDPTEPYGDGAGTGCTADRHYWNESRRNPRLVDCAARDVGSMTKPQLICTRLFGGTPANNNVDPPIAEVLGRSGTQVLYEDGALLSKFVEERVDNQGRTTYVEISASSPPTGDVYCEGEPGPPADAWDRASNITLFDGNYVRYVNDPPAPGPTDPPAMSRIDAIRDALYNLAVKYQDVINIGLMRTSTTGAQQSGGAGKGGMVIFPILPPDGASPIRSGTTVLDDFYWTLYDRVACKQDETCAAFDPKPTPEECLLAAAAGANVSPQCVQLMSPNGDSKPLAELLFEAGLYYGGDGVQYGTRSAVDPTIDFRSVPESLQNPNDSVGNWLYDSPIGTVCTKDNFIVLLTDGISSQDSSSNQAITALLETLPTDTLESRYTDTNQIRCTANTWSANAAAPSECIDDLAFYLANADLFGTDADGLQNVRTYTVGFDLSGSLQEAEARQLLQDTAVAGNGRYFEARSPAELNTTFDEFVEEILTRNTAFSAPSVSVNAFNRTQNLNELYMAVFRPEEKNRWKGNVKKYLLTPEGEIVDARDEPAVNPATGFFFDESVSLWSAGNQEDGGNAAAGGAASQIPGLASRDLITNDGTTMLDLRTYATSLAPADQRTAFGLPSALDDTETDAQVNDLVDWLYGLDLYDEYPAGDGYLPSDSSLTPDGDDNCDLTDPTGPCDQNKLLMGDPLHTRPAIVIYGGTAAAPDATVLISTNEGLLHAIDADTGVEKWAWMPQELMDRMPFMTDFAQETPLRDRTASSFYGLDGTLRVLRIDNDRDGQIESASPDNDRVYLFTNMRRGGSSYYALDITNAESPQLLWKYDLPDGAQSWSAPTIARVNISGVTYDGDNDDLTQRYVLIFGGGFDASNDSVGFSAGDRGNRIIMLDAIGGQELWRAGDAAADADADLDMGVRMRHSFAGDVRVVDLTGDGFADRMYAGDLGGQIWRFDILNGETVSNLVEGGLFASVGGEVSGNPDRRFYYAPDVALVSQGGSTWLNIAIGSGDRENPITDGFDFPPTQNTFYGLRDYAIFNVIDSADYRDDCSTITTRPCHEIIEDDGSTLVDVTTSVSTPVPIGSPGWKLDMVEAAGEKVLAESRTFENKIFFTTYSPTVISTDGTPCGAQVGVNRLYVVSAFDAAPVNNFDGDIANVTVDDRSRALAQGSIAPEVVFVFPTPDPSCTTRNCAPPPQCLVGLESCGRGATNRPVPTFWREVGAN